MDQNTNGKNKIVGIAIAVLILAIGFIWWGESNNNITKENDDNDTNSTVVTINTEDGTDIVERAYTQTRVKENGVYVTTVNLTADGFVPSIVYINHGEAIRFVNKDDGAMRIASNEFQNVPIYSGLGQGTSVGTNGKYEFIFNQKGVWGYNNLSGNPKMYGIVYVR